MLSKTKLAASTGNPASKSDANAALQARIDELTRVNQELQDAVSLRACHDLHKSSVFLISTHVLLVSGIFRSAAVRYNTESYARGP